jgi:hypothetical protein
MDKKIDLLISLEKEFLYLSAKYHLETADHNRCFDLLNRIIDDEYENI